MNRLEDFAWADFPGSQAAIWRSPVYGWCLVNVTDFPQTDGGIPFVWTTAGRIAVDRLHPIGEVAAELAGVPKWKRLG